MKYRVERQHKLVCDSCHHIEPIERVSLAVVDKPCPVCNENLLTGEDYREYCRVERRLKWMERIVRALSYMGLLRCRGSLVARTQIKHGETITRLREGGLL